MSVAGAQIRLLLPISGFGRARSCPDRSPTASAWLPFIAVSDLTGTSVPSGHDPERMSVVEHKFRQILSIPWVGDARSSLELT
jgi:hypothetical protein